MKKIISFTLILFFCANLYSQELKYVRNTISRYYKLDPKTVNLWVKDLNGCKGFRSFFVDKLTKNKLLIGMPQDLFFDLFGKADFIGEDGIFIYFSGCKCDNKLKRIPETDFTQIVFQFKEGKLFSIEVAIP